MIEVIEYLDSLRALSFLSLVVRLLMALMFGGFLGYERAQKRLPAGVRTYMLVCLGACLTVLLSQYTCEMTARTGGTGKTDISRYAAQVISGIGFLGAGTIIVSGRQEVKGLTTAAGLWASACIGIAVGAGFFECVFFGVLFIYISNRCLPCLERRVIAFGRDMKVYVECLRVSDIRRIVDRLREEKIEVYEISLSEDPERPYRDHPGCVLYMDLGKKRSHRAVRELLSEMNCVTYIDEI